MYSVILLRQLTAWKLPINITSVMFGVDFSGYILFYAQTLFLFAIPVLYVLSDTEKYVTGYGILQMTRKQKRSIIVRNIILKRIMDTIMVTILIIGTFIITLKIKKVSYDSSIGKQELIKIGIFALIILNIVLWQSLFEIIWDGRIAVILVLGIVIIHLWMGDMIYDNEINSKWYMLFNVNYGVMLREEQISIELKYKLYGLIGTVFIQWGLIYTAFKRKDIFSVKQ